MAQKIISGLFLFTLLTFPLGQIFRLQLIEHINVTLFDVSVLVTGITWLIMTSQSERKFAGYTLTKPLTLFFLTILLSLFANLFRYSLTEITVAALYAVRFLLFACMYFVVKERSGELQKRIPDVLVLSGGVVVILGYLQFILYPNLRNLYYLGWDEHLVRMFSSFLDPNFAGAFFVLYFIFLLGRIRGSYSTLTKTVSQRANAHGMGTIVLFILTGMTFFAIFLTTSRSAFIMLVVSLITYVILIGRKKWLLFFAVAVIAIFLFGSRFFFIENVNPFRVTSSLARVETARNASEIITKNLLFGVGFNAYRYAQYEYGFRQQGTEYPSHADSGTDNSLLFVFATTGIIGLVTYLFVGVRVFQLGVMRRSMTIMGPVLVASLVGLFVNSIFINSLFYPAVMYWIWVIAGLTDT